MMKSPFNRIQEIRPAYIESPNTLADQYPYHRKRVIRVFDLVTTGRGSEINLDGAGEIAIFADSAIFATFGDYAEGSLVVGQSGLRLRGLFNKVYLRPATGVSLGRVAIYTGRPDLGSFDRENPYLKMPNLFQSLVLAWGAGGASSNALALAVPNLGGSSGMPIEAYYIVEMSLKRTTGTVDSFDLFETETGGLTPILHIDNPVPGSLFVWKPPVPVRVAMSTNLFVNGSLDVASTVDVNILKIDI